MPVDGVQQRYPDCEGGVCASATCPAITHQPSYPAPLRDSTHLGGEGGAPAAGCPLLALTGPWLLTGLISAMLQGLSWAAGPCGLAASCTAARRH